MKPTFLLLMLLWLASCSESNHSDSDSDSRTFSMGFTPWPFAFTSKAQEQTYDNIDMYGDLIAHHFDEGIPWPEALDNENYSTHLVENINHRKSNTSTDKKVYLSVTPLSAQDRTKLALYWGEDVNMQLPDHWSNKSFDDQEVITAYSNFCQFMIDQFQPDYFNYGIEVSGQWQSKDQVEFLSLLSLLKATYLTLKDQNPELPIFVSVMASPSDLAGVSADVHTEISKKCLAFSDYHAISTYPYLGQTGTVADPELLGQDYFSRIRNWAPDKPFAIAETGYIAETLSVYDNTIEIKGQVAWQNEYLTSLLNELNVLESVFVVWFVVQDYDEGWETLKASGADDLFKIWKDTGLFEGNGDQRPALQTWIDWLAKSKL